ncbi:MAG: cupin domain-containing protein [Pseudomonadales bacterium]
MQRIKFSAADAQAITRYDSHRADSVHLADGQGESHVYVIHFGPDGAIGRHPTGFCQLFLVVAGDGWVEGGDGQRLQLASGEGVFFERGESHAKGSATGMTAIMVQADQFALRTFDPESV